MSKEEDFPRSDLSGGILTLDKKKKSALSKLNRHKIKPSKSKHYNDSSHTPDRQEYPKLPTLQTLNPGSLVLGSVALVTSSGLRIHIPNNIVGFAKYSELYDDHDSKAGSTEASLSAPFSAGSNVICYVLEVYRSHAALSLKPSLVNSTLRMESLFPGLLLPSTVISHEDHGLRLSFNATLKKSVQGFVLYDDKARETVKVDMKRRYPVSSTAYVVVSSVNVERGLVKCSWPWSSKTPLDLHTPVVFDVLKPGLLLTGEVSSVHRLKCENSTKTPLGGYTVKCLGSLTATITPLHALESYGSAEEGEDEGRSEEGHREVEDRLEARLILVDFDQKLLYLSIQSQLMRWRGPSGQPHKGARSSVLSCRVARSLASGLVLHPVEGEAKIMFCDLSDVLDDKSIGAPVILASRKYAVGSVHECRVVEFDYLTRLTRVAMRSSLMEDKYVSPLELEPADVVRGRIVKLVNSGAIVQISSLVDGKVPLGHLTQVPGEKLPEGIKIGRNLNLRVLRFDHARNRLVLTAKKELVHDPDPVARFEQLHVGRVALGHLVNTGERSYAQESQRERVVVRFYGELQTVLDKEEVERARANSAEFRTDAVVRCAVMRLDQKKRLFSVTIDEAKIEETVSKANSKREQNKRKRKMACKEAFKNYKSSRKRRKAED